MSIRVQIDQVAEQIADDEKGEMFAEFMACLIREFRANPEEFGKWMQGAMDSARYQIPEESSEAWADDFLVRIEQAAIKLY